MERWINSYFEKHKMVVEMKTFIPHTPPLAPEPEPEAVLRFGDVEIRIGLTFLHHLRNCRGWGYAESFYKLGDSIMASGIAAIERAMWAQIDKAKGR